MRLSTLKTIIGIAVATVLLAPAAASAGDATKSGSDEDRPHQLCELLPVTLPGFTVQAGDTKVRLGEKRDVRICAFADATVGAKPSVRRFGDCGEQCIRVELSDVGVNEQVEIIITYTDDGGPQMVELKLPVVNHTILPGRFLCIATGTPDPCIDRITTPGRPAAQVTKGEVALSWAASEDTDGTDLTGYEIWRSTTAADATFELVGTASETAFSDTGVTKGERYRYYVKAYDAEGNRSEASDTLTVKAR